MKSIFGREPRSYDSGNEISQSDAALRQEQLDIIRQELDDSRRLPKLPGEIEEYDFDKFAHPLRDTPGFVSEARFNNALWVRAVLADELMRAAYTLIYYKGPRDEVSHMVYETKLLRHEHIVGTGRKLPAPTDEELTGEVLSRITELVHEEARKGLPGKLSSKY